MAHINTEVKARCWDQNRIREILHSRTPTSEELTIKLILTLR